MGSDPPPPTAIACSLAAGALSPHHGDGLALPPSARCASSCPFPSPSVLLFPPSLPGQSLCSRPVPLLPASAPCRAGHGAPQAVGEIQEGCAALRAMTPRLVSYLCLLRLLIRALFLRLGFLAVVGIVKLALEAGKATPAPPVGPALGSKGVNIMAFCKEYNARTADKAGYVIPVEITVFDVSSPHIMFFPDKSFTFILKTPPASVLLLKAAGD
ncbi:hypothetical protein B296_00027302 [Ensete ventricosum]|uniref:Large ribosomal subunit protein uL11m n=1 Tax=Ensete ventricosum TaxID=4639 RepID=A0A426ZA87_ENSVE|nr:hypothetical protein B296_00027302 [Ensete ventricosum]